MNQSPNDNPLAEKVVLISKFSDEGDDFSLCPQNTPWLEEILTNNLKELQSEKSKKEISIDLMLKRGSDTTFGEYLFLEGSVKASYTASCIRCLTDTEQSFTSEFKGAYVNKVFEDDPEYEEVDEIFINNQEVDLFFHDRGKADITDIIKEATFSGVNHYPLHKEDCKGLCYTCGVDLNTGSCGH